MIAIRNISTHSSPFGVHEYEVRINSGPVIATFMHKREEGLSKCLAKASAAVEKAKREEVGRTLQEFVK